MHRVVSMVDDSAGVVQNVRNGLFGKFTLCLFGKHHEPGEDHLVLRIIRVQFQVVTLGIELICNPERQFVVEVVPAHISVTIECEN